MNPDSWSETSVS